jgi:hypothetical protein
MAEKTAEQARKDRLARQLRENLKRRKAQARNLMRARPPAPRGEKAE